MVALVAGTPLALTTTGSTGTTTSSSINTTGCSLLIFAVGAAGSSACYTVSDSKGNTWSALTPQDESFLYSAVYYCINPVVGSGHTFSIDVTTACYPSCAIAGFSGTAGLQSQTGAIITSMSTLSCGSVTPGVGGSLIITCLAYYSESGGTYSIDSGLTITNQSPFTSGLYYGSALAFLVQGTAGAIDPTWTFANSAADAATVIAVFNPAPIPVCALTRSLPPQIWDS
jgi:hypothetical protein